MERSVSIEKRVLSKSVLLISYYFPPMPGAGALRPGRLAKFLPVFGWTPTTLTGPWHAGEEFGDVIPVTPLGDPLAARVRGLWRIVTSSARWSPVALRSALTLTARRRFDAVVSVFSPAYSHVLAAIVARRLRNTLARRLLRSMDRQQVQAGIGGYISIEPAHRNALPARRGGDHLRYAWD